jgi:hypothetical protein
MRERGTSEFKREQSVEKGPHVIFKRDQRGWKGASTLCRPRLERDRVQTRVGGIAVARELVLYPAILPNVA